MPLNIISITIQIGVVMQFYCQYNHSTWMVMPLSLNIVSITIQLGCLCLVLIIINWMVMPLPVFGITMHST